MMFEGLNPDGSAAGTALLVPGESDHPEPSWSDHGFVAYDDDLDEDESYFLESEDEEDDSYEDDDIEDFDDEEDESLVESDDLDDDDDL
ncbi:MAG: hypothetical protein LAT64_14600 [Phycisphaerales bacterium]|nr:hypothetical protein [Planctomycetota bacterium]MCH8509978.1 hypothetical protein [Phycisphaerales bacterium]